MINIETYKKKINLSELPSGFYLITLGGAEEIGMNFNLFGYVTKEISEWIIVDVGLSVNKTMGINALYASVESIKNLNIIGVILTHAHLDHIGALPFVMPEIGLSIPMFATKFTASLIKKIFEENNISHKSLNTIECDKHFSIKNFKIEFHYITHSIIEPNMIIVSCPFGSILHTGDWKLDSSPGIGKPIGPVELENMFKNKKIDAIIEDSTNAFETVQTRSENDVKIGLHSVMKKYSHSRVVISCFSSNVARIANIISLAQQMHRPVLLIGSSLKKCFNVAVSLGYVNDRGVLYKDEDNLSSLKKSESDRAIVICTGSQGEKKSILYKIAYQQKMKNFVLQKNDVVVFSARVIPGNEKEISSIKNNLLKFGVKIIDHTNCQHIIHVSGHPAQPEVLLLAKSVNPRFVIPVHGEYMHLNKIKEVIQGNLKIPVLLPHNGCVISIDKMNIVGSIESGVIGVDGKYKINMKSNIISDRINLGENGALFCSIIIKDNKIQSIKISFAGLIVSKFTVEKIKEEINKSTKLVLNYSEENIELLKKIISNTVFSFSKKNPSIFLHKNII